MYKVNIFCTILAFQFAYFVVSNYLHFVDSFVW